MVLSVAGVLLSAWALGPAAEASPDTEPNIESGIAIEPGLSFGEGVTERERIPLRETFDRVREQACTPPPCVGARCSEDQARLGLELTGSDRDYSLHWRVDDPRLSAPLLLESQCQLCSLIDLQDQLSADLGSLCSRLSTLDAEPARVWVNSDPSGAVLRVDGHRVGKTPWMGELDEGEHLIELSASGYVGEQRTITTVDGVEERTLFQLVPVPPDAIRRRPFWPGWTSISVGVVLGVAGTALIAINNKEWPGRCTGDNVDALGNCRFVYATRPLGIGLAAAGAASLTTGLGLMIWAQRGNGRSGGGLALSGRF